MIDQREVIASKLWRDLRIIQRSLAIEENDFNYLLVLLSGCICIENRLQEFASSFPKSVLRKIYNLIRQHHKYDDESLVSHCREMELELHKVLGIEYADVLAKFPRNGIRIIVEKIKDATSNELDAPYLFDVAYNRFISGRNSLDFRFGRRIAELASYLISESTDIWDYFIDSGDLAVLVRERIEQVNEVRAKYLPSNQFPLRLRLALHGIVLMKDSDLPSSNRDSFMLISHPTQGLTREAALRDSSRILDNSALEVYERFLRSKAHFGFALLVIPAADRLTTGTRLKLREYIVKHHLLAVIDLPSAAKTSNGAKVVSLWLVSGTRVEQKDILFVDASKLLKMEGAGNSNESMRFVASLIRFWLSEQLGLPVERMSSNLNIFDGLFRHEFGEGYKDVSGLCKTISRKDVGQNKSSLTASTYLREARRHSQKLPTLDSNPVLKLLTSPKPDPKRIYVIGNNGEGKSLLLAELIEHLAERGISTVGISFGLTDRFPFKLAANRDQPSFTYMGARTGEKAMQLKSTKGAIVWNTKRVQTDQIRLGIFQNVMDLIGFSHSLFMVPSAYNFGNFESEQGQLSDIVRLTDDAQENQNLLGKSAETDFTLGLMRKRSKNEITPFEELSSGEQQVLTLAIKLVSKGDPGTVMLIDEPEISLHVSWQRALPAMFAMISERLGCSIVIATHSPIIIASALNPGDHCFAAQQQTLNLILPRKHRSVEAVLFDNFKTYTHNTRRVHERCAFMVSETIKKLNLSNTDVSTNSIENFLAELDAVSDIVRSIPAGASEEQRDRDIDLIRKTRAAISELVDHQHSTAGDS